MQNSVRDALTRLVAVFADHQPELLDGIRSLHSASEGAHVNGAASRRNDIPGQWELGSFVRVRT